MIKPKKQLAAVLIAVALLLTACSGNGAADRSGGASSSSSAAMNYSPGFAPEALESSGETDFSQQETPPVSDRKIVKNASLNLETMEFDTAIREIEKLINNSGGYVESQELDGKSVYSDNRSYERHASIQARVPAEKLEEVISTVGDLCNITSQTQGIQDITDSYYDTEARLEALQIQEDRLLELLKSAQTMEDMITLESALSDVRYQIESLTSSIRRMDSQVTYSYLDLYIREVVEYNIIKSQPKTFGEKLKASLGRSGENIADTLSGLLFFLIEDGPVLVIYLFILIALILLARKLFSAFGRPIFKGEREARETARKAPHTYANWGPPPPFANPPSDPPAEEKPDESKK